MGYFTDKLLNNVLKHMKKQIRVTNNIDAF